MTDREHDDPPIQACDECGHDRPDVRPTPDLDGRPLCDECWVHTVPPGPWSPPRRWPRRRK